MALHLLHAWENVSVVDHGGSLSAWVHQEDKEEELEGEVEGNERKNETSPLVNNVEESKHDPISQPLLVITSALAFEGNEAHECWICNSNSSNDVGGTYSEEHTNDAYPHGVVGQLWHSEASEACNLIEWGSSFNSL